MILRRPRRTLMLGKLSWLEISPKKGLIWVLGNCKSINFWYDIPLEESPLMQKIIPSIESEQATVGNLITTSDEWNLDILATFFQNSLSKKSEPLFTSQMWMIN